jgi:hypothetical protein
MAGPVLLVHDDVSVIAPAKRLLQREGIDSVLVTNAADAVISFGDLTPPVVVIAPEVDGDRGASIYQEIRAHPKGASTRFVMLGHAIPEAPEAVVVSLPLDGQKLLEAVERALEGDDVSSAWHLAEPGDSPPSEPPKLLAETLFEDEPAEPPVEEAKSPPLDDMLFGNTPAESVTEDTVVDELPPMPVLADDAPPAQTGPKELEDKLFGDLGAKDEGESQLSESLFADVSAEPSADQLADEILQEPTGTRAAPPTSVRDTQKTPTVEDGEESQTRAREIGRMAAAAAAREAERLAELEIRQGALAEPAPLEEPQAELPPFEPIVPEPDPRQPIEAVAPPPESEPEPEPAEEPEVAAPIPEPEPEPAEEPEVAAPIPEPEPEPAEEPEVAAPIPEPEPEPAEEPEVAPPIPEPEPEPAEQTPSESAKTRRIEPAEVEELRRAAEEAERAAREQQGLLEAQAREATERRQQAERTAEELRKEVEARWAKNELELEALAQANVVAQEEEQRALAERQKLEAEAEAIAQRTEASRRRALDAGRKVREETERAEKLKKQADEQERRLQATRQKEEEERRRVEELERATTQEGQQVALRLEQARQKEGAERQALEAEAQRAHELERATEEHQQRLEAVRAGEEEQRRQMDELRRATDEEEQQAAAGRERLEAEAQDLARRREEAQRRLELAQQKLEAEAGQADVLMQAAEEQRRRVAALRAREQAEQKKIDDLRQAAIDEERRVAEEAERLEKEAAELTRRREEAQQQAAEAREKTVLESAELARRREELKKQAEETRSRLDAERAAIEEEEEKVRELTAAAERELQERAEAAHRERELREAEVRRAQEEREKQQAAIQLAEEAARLELEAQKAREEAARKLREQADAKRVRTLPSGKWRGPLRVTELAPAPEAANDPSVERPAVEPGSPVDPGEGFKTTPPALPTEPPFAPRGTLAQLDAASLVCKAFDARLTGRVDIAGSDAQRTLWFEEGRLVAAASSSLMERLEDVALRAGLVTAAQHHALRVSEEKLARRLAMQMVELGYIRPSELYPLVRKRVTEVAFSVFLDESSAYVFTPESPPAEERVVLPMHPYALATEGVRRKLSTPRLWARLGGPATLLRPKSQGFELDYFGLSAKEKRLAAMVDGLRTVEEILFEGGLEEAAALKVLYALAAAGAVEIAVLGRTARPTSPREAARLDLSRVAEKYNQIVAGDYFQILGLRRDASGYEVREAYERLSREFSTERFVGLEDPVLAGRLDEIGRGLAEAADVLTDDPVREEYARSLQD